jgi:hypothetical protein
MSRHNHGLHDRVPQAPQFAPLQRVEGTAFPAPQALRIPASAELPDSEFFAAGLHLQRLCMQCLTGCPSAADVVGEVTRVPMPWNVVHASVMVSEALKELALAHCPPGQRFEVRNWMHQCVCAYWC